MFISDRLVFIELHKTACTHIDNLLLKIVGGTLEGKHNKASPALFDGKRTFVGSIRNPWDWYVSLWAYGCEQKGGLFKHVTNTGLNFEGITLHSGYYIFLLSLLAKFSRDPKKWQESYEDVNDPLCFEQWLQLLHDPHRSFDFGEHYALSPLHNFAGLLTYRYFNLFCSKSGESKPFMDLLSNSDLKQFDLERCFIDSFIRNENLESDFVASLEKAGIEVTAQDLSIIQSKKKTNSSNHDRNTALFYNKATDTIIRERERFIIDKFQYKSPLETLNH